MDNQLDQSTVYKWLEADEERAKTVITSYLNGNKQFLKELTETTTAQQQLLLTPPPAQRRQRLSVVAPPPPLLNTEHAGEHPLQRLTSGPIVSPRKSADELRKLSKNELFMELLRDVVSPDFDINSLSHKILVNVLILINADRSSLFLVEGPKESPILVSRLFDVTEHSSLHEVLHDESEAIKIPFGVGIVGQAAKTGQVINIADAYKNPQFNTKVDKLTGYRTKGILCMPIKTSDGEVIGVAQVINKKGSDEFSNDDIEVFGMYLTFCAIGLINAQLFEQSFTHSQRLQSLLELTRKLFEDTTSMEEMLKCIMSEARKLILCERYSILVVDKNASDIVFRTAVQYSATKGDQIETVNPSLVEGLDVIKHVAETKQTVNISGGGQDVTWLKNKQEVPTTLCSPVLDDKGDLLAVVKVENKLNGLPFNQGEEESFQVFSMFCGLAIHSVINYEKIQTANAKQSVALEVLSYHASASLSETEQFLSMGLPRVEDIQLTSFNFDDLSLSDDMTVLASVLMFKELGFLSTFHINQKTLLQWVLTVRKNYRPVTYHNWRHAFNVAQTMFTLLTAGSIGDYVPLSDIEKLSLLIACFSHDLDHRGTNNAFQSKIDSPLALLYTTSTMEHHHFDHCIMILNCEQNRFLEHISTETYQRIIHLIESAILSTDLALYFKKRNNFFELVKNEEFDSSDENHKELLRGMLMTACDVAAVTKPWNIQRRIAHLVTSEFFEQGDRERNDLNLIPVAMMDRQKQHELPQMQVGFIKSVCAPLFEALTVIDDKLGPLVDGAKNNIDNWEALIGTPSSDLSTSPVASGTTGGANGTVIGGGPLLQRKALHHSEPQLYTSNEREGKKCTLQ